MTVTAVAQPPQTAPQPRQESQAQSLISSDFTTFLKMLTTQLQNQDPLDPMSNSEYAVQLATFSGVEQQVRTNTLLEGLQLGVTGLAQYAGWVGKEARAEMPVWFKGDAVTVTAQPNLRADAVELVATDAQGAIVSRQQVAPGSDSFTWLGRDAQGMPLPTGSYSIALESLEGGVRIATTPVESYARIVELRGGEGLPRVLFEGGTELSVERVTALRDL
jgi:flagellar basal-body rod modification protein FlgD